MSRSYVFLLNGQDFPFRANQSFMSKIAGKISDEILDNGKYYVQSNVDNQVFQSFLNYLLDSNEELSLNINNYYDYLLLNVEFNNKNIEGILSKSEFVQIKEKSMLQNAKSDKSNKNLSEEFISKNLDYFLQIYFEDMAQIPVCSLYNIFNHNKRVLNNQDRAYQFISNIITNNNNNQHYCVLLEALKATKITEQSLQDALSKREERFGFAPIMDYSINENISETRKQIINEIKPLFEQVSNIQRGIQALSEKMGQIENNVNDLSNKYETMKNNQEVPSQLNAIHDQIQQISKKNEETFNFIQQIIRKDEDIHTDAKQIIRLNGDVLNNVQQIIKKDEEISNSVQQMSQKEDDIQKLAQQISKKNEDVFSNVQEVIRKNDEIYKCAQQISTKGDDIQNKIQLNSNKNDEIHKDIQKISKTSDDTYSSVQQIVKKDGDIHSCVQQISKKNEDVFNNVQQISRKNEESFKCVQQISKVSEDIHDCVLIRYNVEFDQLNGIIRKLTREYGGNVHDKGAIEVTASSDLGDPPYRHPKYAVDLDNKETRFTSKNIENSWLRYDFKGRKVRPTHYSIRSKPFDTGDWHPKNWVIEGSNTGSEWKVLDSRQDVNVLNYKSVTHTFAIQEKLDHNEYYRYLRIRQTGRNACSNPNHHYILGFSALEYFGSII